ncbi:MULTISPECIES: hypothetical protein [Pseudomonas]|uniref:hypothetical protein n=1 Tax=Pseudomonas TaxID=286 RepID=UPI001596961F|nr:MULTISPECIES: hypothetical protein [Pseudomonas]
MQASDSNLVQEVKLQPGKQDYQVPGFSNAYEVHSEECADRRHGAGVLMVIGIAIAALGLGIWMFGPSTIYYNRLSGPSFIQHMQIAPHLVVSVGVLFLALAQKVRGEDQLSQELFLLAHYKVIGIDGSDAREHVDIRHIAEDDFNISLSTSKPTPAL